MLDKIKELRSKRPIPMMEAKKLLEDNNQDVEKCVYLYTAKAIKEIQEATGCNLEKAESEYKAEKFDINRAISVIKKEMYDQNYIPIEGVNKTSLQFVKDWLHLVETENFGYSLAYPHLADVVQTLSLIPSLEKISSMMAIVQKSYTELFKNYNDKQPLEEFVRLNRLLDEVPEFQEANIQVPLQISYIKDEVNKHWRNV